MEKEELASYKIPDNITAGKRIFVFRLRNVIEAAISAFIVGSLICLVPFVVRVKIIVVVVVCGSVIFLNLIGIKGMSYSECFINYRKFKHDSKVYCLRSIKYAKKQKKTDYSKTYLNESIAGKGFRIAKEKAQEAKENLVKKK